MSNKLKYHGTSYFFNAPSLYKCKERKDFGKGFYLSENINNAKERARQSFLLNSNADKQKYIYSYSVEEKELRNIGLTVHHFESANLSWLTFVLHNRISINEPKYDVVIGPTADSRAQEIIDDVFFKYGSDLSNLDSKTIDKIIKALKVYRYDTQYCFLTDRALQFLNKKFVERRVFI